MPRGKDVSVYTDSRPKKGGDKWDQMNARTDRPNISWRDCGAEDLLAALVAVTEDGAALLLALTSDGGALSIQVLNGGGRHKLYPSNVAQLNEALQTILEIAEGR